MFTIKVQLIDGRPASLTMCVNVSFPPNNFVFSEPIYFKLTYEVAYVKTFSQVALCTWPSDDLDIQHCPLTICVSFVCQDLYTDMPHCDLQMLAFALY